MLGVILAVLALPLAASPPDATYTITLSPGPAARISVAFLGDADGQTDISVAQEWGGVNRDHLDDIVNVHATAADLDVPIEHPQPHQWHITHQPGVPLVVTYELARHDDRPALTGGNDYRVVLKPGLFHMIANLGLLVPDALRDDRPHVFAAQWSGTDALGWKAASSIGPGPALHTVTMKTDDFTSSVWIAGDIHLIERDIHGQKLGVAIAGDGWGFGPEDFAGQVARVITAEREFFRDHRTPWYLVSLVPVVDDSGRSMSLGGTGLTDSFALFATTNMGKEPGGMSIQHLLAHEYFHNWNGHVVSVAQPEQLAYWFSEGFTDYFARRIMFEAGMLDAKGYVDDLNEKLSRARENPLRNAPNSKVLEAFWTDHDASDLPYQRGDLAAVAIDDAIRAKSGGTRSLNDVMRELVNEARDGAPPPDTQTLLARFERETNADLVSRLRAFIVDGLPFEPPSTLRSPAAKLVERQVRSSDPGFDVHATETSGTGEVRGVVDGNAAHAAGLRNGQKLREFSLSPGPTGQPPRARVVVEDAGRRKTIEYDAVGEPKPARMYEIDSDGTK